MKNIYIGTWGNTSGRSACLLNHRKEPDGSYRCVQQLDMPTMVSLVKIDRKRRQLFVLVNGDPDVEDGCGGAVIVYQIDCQGMLHQLQKETTYGSSPIDIALWDQQLAIVNHGSTTNRVCRTVCKRSAPQVQWVYDESSLVLMSRNPDGTIGDYLDIHRFEGHGDIPFFQESAAPHSLFAEPKTGLVLVPERGSDCTSVFNVADVNLQLLHRLSSKKGSGPRNAVITPDGKDVYVVHEITPHVSHFRMPREVPDQTLETVTDEAKNRCDTDPRLLTSPHPVAIWLSRDERYIYTVTRSTETLSVYERNSETGLLTFLQEWRLSGENPRDVFFAHSRFYIILMDSAKIAELTADETSGRITNEVDFLSDIPGIATVAILED